MSFLDNCVEYIKCKLVGKKYIPLKKNTQKKDKEPEEEEHDTKKLTLIQIFKKLLPYTIKSIHFIVLQQAI